MERPFEQAKPALSPQPRIVIADDFETLRRGLKSLLGSMICGEAENGQQAVEKVMELRPDIIILDFTMPVMNGLEAARRIRSLAPETKIIVFSLHDGDIIKEEALQAGADAFLHKTATGEDILKTIATVMDNIPERSQAATRKY
jgi:DNA-binding NarL/FixJ family response regulator